jgi:hypothetical protein
MTEATLMTSTDDDGWITFTDRCIERARRLPIVDVVARLQEAERLTLKQIYTGKPNKLEIRWLDDDGHAHIGMPTNFWVPFYDSAADCLRERLPGGRALYQPKVRDRQPNLDKPADEAVAPAIVSDGPVKRDESLKSDESGGHDKLAEPDEASGRDERDKLIKLDEPVVDQWPWQKDPTLLKAEDSAIRRVQRAFEKHLKPTSVKGLSVKDRTELIKPHFGATESTVRRAFGEK